MPADRILTVLHNGHPAYFQVSRDVGGGSVLDVGQIAMGQASDLRAGQVLRCGTCGEAISHAEQPVEQPRRQIAHTYRPYLDEETP